MYRLRALAVPALASVLMLACSTSDDGGDGTASDDVTARPRRGATVCFAGAHQGDNPLNTEGNDVLAALCEQMPGLIRADELPFFTFTKNAQTAVTVVVKALDTNG